jgi:hypothetical protein
VASRFRTFLLVTKAAQTVSGVPADSPPTSCPIGLKLAFACGCRPQRVCRLSAVVVRRARVLHEHARDWRGDCGPLIWFCLIAESVLVTQRRPEEQRRGAPSAVLGRSTPALCVVFTTVAERPDKGPRRRPTQHPALGIRFDGIVMACEQPLTRQGDWSFRSHSGIDWVCGLGPSR